MGIWEHTEEDEMAYRRCNQDVSWEKARIMGGDSCVIDNIGVGNGDEREQGRRWQGQGHWEG